MLATTAPIAEAAVHVTRTARLLVVICPPA
jgi:hypothetical protein